MYREESRIPNGIALDIYIYIYIYIYIDIYKRIDICMSMYQITHIHIYITHIFHASFVNITKL